MTYYILSSYSTLHDGRYYKKKKKKKNTHIQVPVWMWGRTLSPPPHELFWGGIFGQGKPPIQKIKIFPGLDRKLLPACPTSKKPLSLHSWRPSMHFTFKVPNLIYMFISIEQINNWLKVKPPINHVFNLEVKNITKPCN